MRYPLLSFLELQRWAELLSPVLMGARIDRIFVPECPEHPQGFNKNEWVFELYSPRNGGAQLLLSLRSQAAGIAYLPAKSLRLAKTATRSAFDLELSKTIEGHRIIGVSALGGERMMQLKIQGDASATASGGGNLALYLNLIPSQPEAILVGRDLLLASKPRTEFHIPPIRLLNKEQLAKIPNRVEWFSSLQSYSELWMNARSAEAIQLRQQKLITSLDHQAQAFARKLKSIEEQADQSRNSPDWNYFGKLLQTHFHAKPELVNGHYSLLDYEKDETVLVPGDLKLNLKQQLEKYFHQAKRNRTRLQETTSRIASVKEKLALIEKDLLKLRADSSIESPEVFLKLMREIEEKSALSPTTPDRDASKKLANYSGKTYRSQEGLTILSGRSKEENLELTFKVARGNDIWLHVKGRPGSHTIILLPPKRSASLDTLLDAATLCILHSGGKEWGKTEVDYTQRKFVKKIKNQTDVSYSGNKTLAVTIEPERLKRLYGETK